jgi:cysteine desulfurase
MKLFGKNKKSQRIFLDYASATPMLPEVKFAMDKYFNTDFYNPSAIYKEGKKLQEELVFFRKEIAKILHVSNKDIIFTSGGSESDNQAILGVFEFVKEKVKVPHMIISSIEHAAVIEAAKEMVRRGGELTMLGVNEEGLVSLEELKNSIKPNTVLVSIMLANNEIGTIEPISKISRIIKEFRKKNQSEYPYFHSDASQAVNYLDININSLGVDMFTLDGGKFYGPKSTGLLVIRPNVKIKPIIFGGGQERGLRSGTENLALIAGLYTALKIVTEEKQKEKDRLEKLKNFFIETLKKDFEDIIINTPKISLPHIVSISKKGIIGELIALKLDNEGIMISTGSSCGIFKDIGGSETIKALSKDDLAESTLRFSFGRYTNEKDIKITLKILKKSLF